MAPGQGARAASVGGPPAHRQRRATSAPAAEPAAVAVARVTPLDEKTRHEKAWFFLANDRLAEVAPLLAVAPSEALARMLMRIGTAGGFFNEAKMALRDPGVERGEADAGELGLRRPGDDEDAEHEHQADEPRGDGGRLERQLFFRARGLLQGRAPRSGAVTLWRSAVTQLPSASGSPSRCR